MDMMTTVPKRKRQERSPELKAQVLVECEQPGASVAQVALAHGINANLVHGWRRLERERRQVATDAVTAAGAALKPVMEPLPFVPVTVTPSTSEATIEIELRRGALTMKATWPLSAATQCATWAREILR
jgi:transposase